MWGWVHLQHRMPNLGHSGTSSGKDRVRENLIKSECGWGEEEAEEKKGNVHGTEGKKNR